MIRKTLTIGLVCSLFLPQLSLASVSWGDFTNPYSDTALLEQQLGKKFDNFLWYQSIIENFDVNLANQVKADGKHLQLAWEPRDPGGDPINQPAYKLSAITAGTYDVAITRWANQLKAFNDTVYFRPMSEMNGNWTSWSGTTNGNTPSDYVPAWRHVHDIFTAVGATNVKWFFAPNYSSYPATFGNDPAFYYPGDDYVDYIGMNGYNTGTPWQEFASIFGPLYKKIGARSILDHNFAEIDAGTSAFTPQYQTTLSTSTIEHFEGSNSLQVANSGNFAFQGIYFDVPNYQKDKDYTFSVYLKGSGTVYLAVNDGTGESQSAAITLDPNKWQRAYVTRKIAANASQFRAFVLTPTAQANQFYADSLAVDPDISPDIYTWANKPVVIAETGSSETGGSKASWINNMFAALATSFPRVEQAYWFDVNKEQDWRVNSSSTALAAFVLNFNPIKPNPSNQALILTDQAKILPSAGINIYFLATIGLLLTTFIIWTIYIRGKAKKS